ncbi:MAG TPA: adenylate/guanylate cyclase domain-containing protein [Solirubrobacterales bacterium]|nr:adenylate/guanylate cyclase domain-containing protein [Solirubrobacterales bacterium]
MSEDPGKRPARRFIAAARRFNRQPRLVKAARHTRERTLGDDRFVDLMSISPGRPSDLAAQQLVILRGDTPGVLGELGLTALQAWQRLAESQDRGRGKVDVAVLFTDLVGFSTWALQAGDRAAIRLLREVTAAIEPAIAEQRGEVVKRLGDGLMAAFWDAPGAVEAAFSAAERTASIEVEGHRPQLRTGIHLGRPRKVGRDYLGVDVNIAARLCQAAKPGELLVSNHTLAQLEPGMASAKKRRFSAKGAPAELTAYALARPA